jgi:hypothetical protein
VQRKCVALKLIQLPKQRQLRMRSGDNPIKTERCKTVFLYGMNISDDLQSRWWSLEAKLLERFGKKPDMEAILFLIGMQETGFVQSKITKEQKQDLMHVAVCTLLSESGYYLVEGKDEEGWPHFRQLKEIPSLHVIEQENFLKDHVLLYFEKHGL